ncbi:MAG: PAS domain S-box protein [Comamonadaceae bacterium]|nr:MAG: PAS domain S-box protein [Comamonadaceae bacterium]
MDQTHDCEATHALPAEQARSLVEFAPEAIFVADSSGHCTYANAAAARMLERGKEEIVGLPMTDLVRPGDSKLLRKDGSWLDVEITATSAAGGYSHFFVRAPGRRAARDLEREALLQQVEAERAWLDAVIYRLPVGVVLFGDGGRTTFNQAAHELLGGPLSPDAGVEQYADRIFYPDGRKVPLEDFPSMRALRRGESLAATEFIIRREDGSQSHVITSSGPIRDGEGRVLGAVGVFQDVTERMRLQRAVRDNERLMEAVFELMPTGVRVADAQGTVIRTNRAARELWRGNPDGPTKGEMKAWWVRNGEALEHQDWPARRAARGETVANELVRMQCFDGSFRTVMKCAAPLRDDAGHITGAVVVDEDVTALYEAKEKLEAGERLFRTVFELLPVGVYITDRDGKVVLGNREGERIWGGLRYVGPDEFQEYKGWWIDTGQPIASDEWGVARAVRRGETALSELIRIQAFDGSMKVVMNWAAPLRSESGEITGAVALNQDVTPLYHTQEQLRGAVREREHILSSVAHDLRNPLNALRLHAAACSRRMLALPGGEELRRRVESLGEIARDMSGLVDDLLAISVGHAGPSMLKLTPIESEAVVRKAAELAQPSFAAAGVDLVVQAEPGMPIMMVDVERIQRVFANLLDNACKFTAPGGRVVLEVESQPGAVLFGMANTGPALSPEQMERMFQPFWQATHDDRRGAGLGMSICRSIIEAHGGSIWAEAAPGMQVHVRFLLPTSIPQA